MLSDVPDADVVITNPEHFAVALKYDLTISDAPIVVAKGLDLMALKIREIAAAHDVEQIQVPPLARAVYFSTDIGVAVPAGLYVAIAQVLAYVFQLKEFRRGGLETRPVIQQVEVPDEFAQPLYQET
jgi:flagellar biosynthetic protein FlhB